MTTYPTSTVPAARAWLFAQLEEVLEPDGDRSFELTYANNLYSPARPDDQVWLGSVVRTSKPLAMVGNLGQYSMQETYMLTVNISCLAESDDPLTVETRAWGLIGQIETVVRTDPSFGGLLITAKPDHSTAEEIAWDDAGSWRALSASVAISCLASN